MISGPSGLRPDLDVHQGQPIASALAAMIAHDGLTRIEYAAPEPMIMGPSFASTE